MSQYHGHVQGIIFVEHKILVRKHTEDLSDIIVATLTLQPWEYERLGDIFHISAYVAVHKLPNAFVEETANALEVSLATHVPMGDGNTYVHFRTHSHDEHPLWEGQLRDHLTECRMDEEEDFQYTPWEQEQHLKWVAEQRAERVLEDQQ